MPDDSSKRHPSAIRGRVKDPRPFRFPTGLEMIEGENYRQRECYDVIFLKDEETPRYQYTIVLSADAIARAFERLAELLPEENCVVLEVPGSGDEGSDVCDIWASPPVGKRLFLEEFRRHRRLFVHDGLVGFGAVSPDGLTELFLDEHKLIYFYTCDMDGPDAVLAGLGVRGVDTVRHFSELGHIHHSLSGKGMGEPYWEVAESLRRTFGLEWEESKEYT